jgi:hypothetical protein
MECLADSLSIYPVASNRKQSSQSKHGSNARSRHRRTHRAVIGNALHVAHRHALNAVVLHGDEHILIDGLHGHHKVALVVDLVNPKAIKRTHEERASGCDIVRHRRLHDCFGARLHDRQRRIKLQGVGVRHLHVHGALVDGRRKFLSNFVDR